MVISCQHPVNAAADKVLGYTAAVSSRSWTTFLVADLIIGPTSRGQLPYWRCKIPSWQRYPDNECNRRESLRKVSTIVRRLREDKDYEADNL